MPATMIFSSHDLLSYVAEGSLLLHGDKREGERERERESFNQHIW